MMESLALPTLDETPREIIEELESVAIRFAGDSGDGMQLTGTQLTNTSAVMGNDVSTMPDFPAEIRAPAGTIPGVSGFQLHFASTDIHTPGDAPQVLVAMNPAALKANLKDLEPGGTVIVNSDEFTTGNLKKAAYVSNPLEDDSLRGYRLIKVPLTTLNRHALEGIGGPGGTGLGNKERDRCKNFFALGLTFWMYDRSLETSLTWIQDKFKNKPQVIEANTRALKAGYNYGETVEEFRTRYRVKPFQSKPGTYRKITGNEAAAMGFAAAAHLAGKPLFYGSYPITPASDILHHLAGLKNFDVRSFQAEDEIAAIASAIGAAFGGAFALTGTSGPGIALKSEAMNLAIMMELPLVVVDVQRGGPSTGLPTKTEQSDLLQVMFGRNGESPLAILAPSSPSDCFTMAIEAFRLATRAMCPVVFLSDGYLANSSEPWRIPDPADLPRIEVTHRTDPEGFSPYVRDEFTLGRPWAIPGTPGLEHRVGGLEKADRTGNVSYSPQDHEHMVKLRAEKIQRLQNTIPEQTVFGPEEGDLLVIGWGGTHGALHSAVAAAQSRGHAVAHAHIRYMNPFPRNLQQVIGRYKRVLVAELNLGQLALLINGKFGMKVDQLNKVQGQPFKIAEVLSHIESLLAKN